MIDVPYILQSLAVTRPVFHSEADFQHALAWELHQLLPKASVRLELPVAHNGKLLHVDIWITTGTGLFVIELKYKTRMITATIAGEQFRLLNQGAQDLGRYDFLKDIQRLEHLTRDYADRIGYAVLLTNDSSYWTLGRNPLSVDSDFRLHEGRVLQGRLGWGDGASLGTTRGREAPLELSGEYMLHWSDYSRIDERGYREFRYVCVTV